MRFLFALAILTVFPGLAYAHSGAEHVDGLAYGFLHPLGGIDHMLAMLAVGVLAAILGGRALWMVPLTFLGVMVLGFGLGLTSLELPFAELAIALSSVIIGIAVMQRRPMHLVATMAMVGGFAVFHGYAHGAEMPGTVQGIGYAAGFIAATAMLHLAGLVATRAVIGVAERHAPLFGRIAGGTIALGGVGVLAGWL